MHESYRRGVARQLILVKAACRWHLYARRANALVANAVIAFGRTPDAHRARRGPWGLPE